MADTCSRTVRITCAGQEPFDLTYPDCETAKLAQFRLQGAAKKCNVALTSSAGFGGVKKKHRRTRKGRRR